MEAVTIGALFLLSLYLPASAADPSVTAAGTDTPLLIVLGIGSAAGVGALLSLTGHAVWNICWPYSSTGGWRQVLPRRYFHWVHSDFRWEIAEKLGPYWDVAGEPCPRGGDRAIVSTAFLLYTEAPAEVRGWIRRRHNRFSDALSAAAAILMGVVSGFALYPDLNGMRLGLVFALVVVAILTFAHGLEARHQSIAMEKYWFLLRAHHMLGPDPATLVALEPGGEITVRPSLRPARH
jgi:hypothetical protein